MKQKYALILVFLLIFFLLFFIYIGKNSDNSKSLDDSEKNKISSEHLQESTGNQKSPPKYSHEDISKLKELLRDPKQARDWRDYIFSIVFYDGKNQLDFLLNYISSIPEAKKNVRMGDPDFFDINSVYAQKINGLALLGLIDTAEANKMLLDAYQNPESLKLISNWLEDARKNGYERENDYLVPCYKSAAALGLIYSQKPEFVDLVYQDFENLTEKATSYDALDSMQQRLYDEKNPYERMYYNWLVDAMVNDKVIKQKGKEYLFFSEDPEKEDLLQRYAFETSYHLKDVAGFKIEE